MHLINHQDGLPGIYVPLNIKAEASKEAADEAHTFDY